MCVAYGCNNRKKKTEDVGRTISFHRFPTDPNLREKWIRAIRRDNWQPSNHSRICSDHFKESEYDLSSPFRKYLNKDAVPSVIRTFPPHLQASTSNSKARRILKRDPSPIQSPIEEKLTKTDLKITREKFLKTQQKLRKT